MRRGWWWLLLVAVVAVLVTFALDRQWLFSAGYGLAMTAVLVWTFPWRGRGGTSQAELDRLPADDPAQAEGADADADASAADLGIDIPDDASSLDDAATDEPLSEDAQLAAERLADLQRINAEYAAYRMRATREQERAKESGVVSLAEALIPVLDEARLAEENGDVTGPFEVHVTKLFATLEKAGVVQYGKAGEEFDPAYHEALMQQPSDEVDGPTIFMVMQPGYRYGERIIRAARVGVQQPAD